MIVVDPGSAEKPLLVPVILGTPRHGRMSEHVAHFVLSEIAKLPDVETVLVDVRRFVSRADEEGEAARDPELSELCMRADAFVLVAPEYNHGYPGLLKHVLDSNLKEYIHKPVGICGVSAGAFGGTRVIENLLPVLRELGLVTIFWDGNFSRVHTLFDEKGTLRDEAYVPRIEKFGKELVWMAKALRHGREKIPLA